MCNVLSHVFVSVFCELYFFSLKYDGLTIFVEKHKRHIPSIRSGGGLMHVQFLHFLLALGAHHEYLPS